MAAEMMNGGLFQPNEPAVSLPWILIAEVASHCSEFNGKQTFSKLWSWFFGGERERERRQNGKEYRNRPLIIHGLAGIPSEEHHQCGLY